MSIVIRLALEWFLIGASNQGRRVHRKAAKEEKLLKWKVFKWGEFVRHASGGEDVVAEFFLVGEVDDHR